MAENEPISRWDYVEKYNRSPVWVKVLLAPLLIPVILIHGTVGLAVVLLIVLPAMLVRSWVDNRRFWRRMRDQGRLCRWSEVASCLNDDTGTLVVEMTFKGLGCSWYIAHPRSEIDPERVAPSWHEFAGAEWAVLESPRAGIEAVQRWARERLTAYESLAHALLPTTEQLALLSEDVRRDRVLVVAGWWDGCLSQRLG